MPLLAPVVLASHKGVISATVPYAGRHYAWGNHSISAPDSDSAKVYPFCGLANDTKGMHINVDNLIPMINLNTIFVDFVP